MGDEDDPTLESRFGPGCGSVRLNSVSSFSASIVAVSVCASKCGRIATTLELQLLHQLFSWWTVERAGLSLTTRNTAIVSRFSGESFPGRSCSILF